MTEEQTRRGRFDDLEIEIESYNLPDGVTMGDPGEVEVSVTNVGNRQVHVQVHSNFYALSNSVINTRILERTDKEVNDGLLMTVEDIRLEELQPGESRTVTIDENITSQRDQLSQKLGNSLEEIGDDTAAEMMGMAYEISTTEGLLQLQSDELKTDDFDKRLFEPSSLYDPFYWGFDYSDSSISVNTNYIDEAMLWAVDSTDEILELPASDRVEIDQFYSINRGGAYKPNKHLNRMLEEETSTLMYFEVHSDIETFL